MRIPPFLMSAASALVLAACAAGPDYKAPTLPPVASFQGAADPAVSSEAAVQTWWRLYDDPVLDGLVADALSANTDLRVAVARLAKSRALLGGVRSERLPDGAISAGGTYGRQSAMDVLPGADREGWRDDGGLSISYEIDLFGRVSRSVEAAKGDWQAAAFDADAVRVAVVADTTRAYVDAAAAAERLAIARRSLDLLDQSVRLTERRQEAGRAARLDVLRIQALREQRAALLPGVEAERQAALVRLAILTGRTLQDLPAEAGARTTTPRIATPIPVGDGAALLARRPDIRAAERRLAADTARIGVATSALYPKISLGGEIGQSSTGLGDLFGAGPFRFLAGPLISWSFPNGQARARVAASRADTAATLAIFDGAVLKGLGETETALSTYARTLDQRAALQRARDAAEAAVRVVRSRQREGQVAFLDVLEAERTFADTETQLADADGRIADAQVDLFRALGGGWGDQATSHSTNKL